MIKELSEFIQLAKEKAIRRIVVAAAEDEDVLIAVKRAAEEGIVVPILVGDQNKISRLARSVNFDLGNIEIIDSNDNIDSCRIAVEMVKKGNADILMKGLTKTSDLLKAVLDKQIGLSAGKLISHVAFFQSPYYHKIFCVTDVAMNIAPTLEDKVQIINNAVSACHQIGIKIPKVAVAAAVETVNPKMEATLHAARLKEMNLEGIIKGCVVDGPLAIDLAVSREAALHKGIVSDVAGDCDVILAPDIEAGNMFYKALNFLGGAASAAIIMGASAPIVLTSRSDNDKSKLLSIALAALIKN
ncbi:MAG: bifunctional enoyl-CoA hydratase/phosphate acetyltransferase [Fermentimonas sp.]|nr:bifunctional enoyl-CoA hydratase/phosphate acetyltransferase [Fermentimonas sp.]